MRRLHFALALPLLGTATPLHAAEGGLLDVNPGLSIWTIIIFLIVLAVLGKFAYPKILGAVEEREAHLRETIEAAERDRAEAAALLAEARRELEETHAKVHEAIAESRTGAERMRDEILAEARREQEAIMQRARRDIAAEREAALEAVRRDAVDMAILAAEKLVRRDFDAEDNRRLVRDYLGELASPGVPAGV